MLKKLLSLFARTPKSPPTRAPAAPPVPDEVYTYKCPRCDALWHREPYIFCTNNKCPAWSDEQQ